MKNKFRGITALLLATLIWGSAFVAQSVGMEKLGPFTFQTFRCLLAVLFLAYAVFVSNPKGFTGCWRSKKLWKSGILCGTALFAASSLQQVGLVYTDAGKAGFLTAMYIVLVPLLGLFLGRQISMVKVVSLILAVGGLYLLSCTGMGGIASGDLLLIGCAIAFAVQITLIDRFAKDLEVLPLNCVQCLTCAVLSAVFMFATEEPHWGDVLACWLPIGYAGVLSLGVAYTLQIVGQRYLDSTTATLLMSLESVVAALSGWLLLNERMSMQELAGCALMFAAVIISQLPEKLKVEN